MVMNRKASIMGVERHWVSQSSYKTTAYQLHYRYANYGNWVNREIVVFGKDELDAFIKGKARLEELGFHVY